MNEKELIAFINDISLDLRTEVVISDLISSGYNIEDLFVKPAGIFNRSFSKDILNAELIELKNNQKVVFVNTSREGIYDMLPQAIFHNPPMKGSGAFKSASSMVSDYKRRIAEEEETRNFFSIYEIEFFRQRIANAILERNVSESIAYRMDDKGILSYWRLPDIFDNRQKGILFYLFPVFHKIRGSLEYMKEVYQLIFNLEIDILKTEQQKPMHYTSDNLVVGKMVLSLDSVLGDNYTYYYPTIEIIIKNLKNSNVSSFTPNSKNIKIIEKLNEYFVPIHCETAIKVETTKNNWVLKNEDLNESRLGYSVYL